MYKYAKEVYTALKSGRQTAIRDLLAREPVASQDALRRKLAGMGFHVTQATLSRDIRALQLAKGPGGYTLPATGRADAEHDLQPGIREVLHSFGLEVRMAMNQVVILATTGGAQPIAAGIDYEEWDEVVGTIAGDDTVLVICPDAKQARTVCQRVEAYIG